MLQLKVGWGQYATKKDLSLFLKNALGHTVYFKRLLIFEFLVDVDGFFNGNT